MGPQEPTREDSNSSPTSTAPLAMQPGDTILGKFKIVELLGQGGMGSVFRVDHLYLGRQFALKCLNKQQANDVSWRRFQNEAKAASKLDHPNLIKVHEFDLLPDGRPFILMDLVNGTTLENLTKNIGSLPVNRAVDIMIQVAFAIQYAHDQGIIHRDLKPTNIMVIPPEHEGEKESVKLVDFGIAKLTGIDEFNQQTLTKTGEIFGSPLYMSPEQCTGTMVDHRTDLYSIGCVFYELLTGAPPFIGENALSTMMKHQTETQLSLKEASMGTNFPPVLEQIVSTLLEKDPNRRYQNGNALVIDLIPLTQADSNPNSLKLPKPKETIPSRQGQTTQFLPSDQSKAGHKSQPVLAIVLTAIVCFIAGYAMCYFFPLSKGPGAGEPSPKPATDSPTIQSGSFHKTKGSEHYFHFPPEIKTLGLLCFDQPTPSKRACLKVPIPPNRAIGLSVDPYLLEHPELWDGFRPEDLSVIDFGNYDKADSKSFAKLARFSNLRILNVGRTSIQGDDMKYLDPLQSLLSLTIGYNIHLKATDLLKLKILPNLRCLDVSGTTDIGEIFKNLATLPNLRQLIAANCDVKNDDLKSLAANKSLKILSLSCNERITDAGVKHLIPMKQLQWLNLTGTSVTPKCVESLVLMRDLNEVEMKVAQFTPAQLHEVEAKLKRAKPNLKFHSNEVETRNTSLTMPEFPWKGPWLNTSLDEIRVNKEFEDGFKNI